MVIKHKRSDVDGKIPTTSDLELGELAVNTKSGTVYLKKDDGLGSEEITSLGTVGNDTDGTPDIVNNIWTGTQDQYDALGGYLNDVLYFIKV